MRFLERPTCRAREWEPGVTMCFSTFILLLVCSQLSGPANNWGVFTLWWLIPCLSFRQVPAQSSPFTVSIGPVVQLTAGQFCCSPGQWHYSLALGLVQLLQLVYFMVTHQKWHGALLCVLLRARTVLLSSFKGLSCIHTSDMVGCHVAKLLWCQSWGISQSSSFVSFRVRTSRLYTRFQAYLESQIRQVYQSGRTWLDRMFEL